MRVVLEIVKKSQISRGQGSHIVRQIDRSYIKKSESQIRRGEKEPY